MDARPPPVCGHPRVSAAFPPQGSQPEAGAEEAPFAAPADRWAVSRAHRAALLRRSGQELDQLAAEFGPLHPVQDPERRSPVVKAAVGRACPAIANTTVPKHRRAARASAASGLASDMDGVRVAVERVFVAGEGGKDLVLLRVVGREAQRRRIGLLGMPVDEFGRRLAEGRIALRAPARKRGHGRKTAGRHDA